ncbi:MAG: SUMF1/EgtB/PvdO family nonheme iron enzyme [Candidatus Hydrogenedentes bacterium]|nr:SUMF1/EgtB/PvdO family nonheme iron enzyme [Candidatus Hydrogenedentota bacterium]
MRKGIAITLSFVALFLIGIVVSSKLQQRNGGTGGIRGSGGAAAPPAAAEGSGQKYAVVIGVNHYNDTGIGNLEYAVADAVAVHQALTGAPSGFEAARAVLLADNQPDERKPTRANILSFLNTYVNLAGASDTVLVYFAGHGTTEEDHLYLLPSDAKTSMLHDTAVPFERLREVIEQSPAQRKVLVLDACHSGAGRAVNKMTQAVGAQFEQASRGMVVLASCGPEEVSREMADTGHGAFTHFLLEGLGGAADANGDGLIGAKELSNFTWDHTRLWAASKGWEQNPWEHSRVSGDIILARPYVVGPGAGETRPPVVVTPPPPPPPPKEPEPGEVRVFEGGEFAWIPPGTFEMGSKLSPERVIATYAGEEWWEEWKQYFDREHPRHTVTLTRGFWLATKEVTVGEFRAFADAAGYQTDAEKGGSGFTLNLETGSWEETRGASWRNPGWTLEDRQPVVLVSWNDAVAYCEWLSRKTGETYRLPAEAQWEYACRAGTDTEFWWGDRMEDGRGCLNGEDETQLPNGNQRTDLFPFSDGYWNVSPVGSFKANPWNLYDMHGNVWEWGVDWLGDYPSSSVTDPAGPASGEYRVVRGGSWYYFPWCCRSPNRGFAPPENRGSDHGFRLLRTP